MPSSGLFIRRVFATTRSIMSSKKPVYVKADESALEALSAKGWTRAEEPPALLKTFKFKGFKSAFAWMTSVADSCNEINHHPEWFNVYNRVDVKLTTHATNSLTGHDVALAQAMDQAAESKPVKP